MQEDDLDESHHTSPSMMSSYESDGVRLMFHDSGDGLPVIFLHPTPFDHRYWMPTIDRLDGMRMIAPDLRGHGESELVATGRILPAGEFLPVPDAPALTIGQLAQDTLNLLDVLETDQAVFVGCSIGGYILLELWRRAPERMKGLCFICSKPQADADAALKQREQTIARIRTEGPSKVMDEMVRTLVGSTSQSRRPQIVRELRAEMTLTAEALIAVQVGLALRPDSTATVASISVPTLAIAGGEDKACPPEQMEAFKGSAGGCKLHVLADAGHLAAYEYPERVAVLLSDWLKQF